MVISAQHAYAWSRIIFTLGANRFETVRLKCDLQANEHRRGLDYEIRKSAIEKRCSELKASAADAGICRDLAKTKANRLCKHAISSLLSAAERTTLSVGKGLRHRAIVSAKANLTILTTEMEEVDSW